MQIGYKSYHNNDATGETALLAEGRQTRSPVSLVDTPDFKGSPKRRIEQLQANTMKEVSDVKVQVRSDESRESLKDSMRNTNPNKLVTPMCGIQPTFTTQLLSGEDDALWRVNADEFNRRFRHIACAALVREKVNEAAGHLLLTMLEITRTNEIKVNEERSSPVSEADVLQKLRESDAQVEIESIKRVLEKLTADTSELISCVGENHRGANYCVNMRRIVDLIRIKEVEAVVRERFGGPACRIFRLLLLKRNLEQKQIAEMAMIPVKDTRELLYKLLKAEYVQIQEVARTSDHAPSRTFYLWRVDLLRVVEQVGHELYRTTSNLRARLIHELSQERETLMLLERAQDKIARGGESTVSLTSGQRVNLIRMRTIATRLESSLLRLDELVLIFNFM